MEKHATDRPRSIDIRSTRAIALAQKYQFEGESLTKTVERILERYDAAEKQRADPSPQGTVVRA